MSKAQYILAMTLSAMITIGSIVAAISSLDTFSKANEEGMVRARYRGGEAEYPAHFVAFSAPAFLFFVGLGFAYLAHRSYHDEL
ncbi:MAG: hypothetical protein WHS44_08515 [Fimbriimonadales bacterium]|nr:MAG: hypothetical protein KatS3mg018_1559 [Fimbriimonadales bacterium]